MSRLAILIGNLTKETLDLEVDIKSREAIVVRIVTSEPKYFRDGKVLPMNVIEATYRYTGLEDELLPLRKQYAEKCGDLEKTRKMFMVCQDKIKVFQTESSNMRGALG
jgi:hypothetical protein